MKATNKEMSVRKLWTSNELLDVINARKAVSIGKLRGEALHDALGALREPELISFLSNVEVGRVAKIVAVSSIDDLDLLIRIAAGDGPGFVRRNALHRIDELCDGAPLDALDAQRLVPCLGDKSLIGFAVELMDMSDFDWPAHCDSSTVGALCEALYECTSMYESVLIEDACAHLTHLRPDLQSNISACTPAHYPMVA